MSPCMPRGPGWPGLPSFPCCPRLPSGPLFPVSPGGPVCNQQQIDTNIQMRLQQTGFTLVTEEHREVEKQIQTSNLFLDCSEIRDMATGKRAAKSVFIYMKLYSYVPSKVKGRDGIKHKKEKELLLFEIVFCCLLFNWSAAKKMTKSRQDIYQETSAFHGKLLQLLHGYSSCTNCSETTDYDP